MQLFPHRDLGGDPGNGIAGGFTGQGRAAADPGIHLDDVVGGVSLPRGADSLGHQGMGSQGKLNVAAALDPQPPDNLQAGGAQQLVLFVGEGLAGGHHDAVAGVDADGVQVLHIADGDAIVGAVAHHLVLDLLPSRQGALQEYLGDGAGGQAMMHNGLKLLPGAGDAAAGAAQGVGGPHHQGKPQLPAPAAGLLLGRHGNVGRLRLPDVVEEIAEEPAVFRLANGLQGRAQQPDAIPVQHPGVRQGHRQVQPRLAPQGGQDSLGALPLDNPLQHLHRQRLDVNAVGDALVRHDGGGVGVDQDGGDAFLPQRFAGLSAGVVKLRCLANDDGARTDHQDLFRFPRNMDLPLCPRTHQLRIKRVLLHVTLSEAKGLW